MSKVDKRKEKIYVRINKTGFIPQLKIQGPVIYPIRITRGQAHSLIVAGISVYEVDPSTGVGTELTIKNVFGEKVEPAGSAKEDVSAGGKSVTSKENKNYAFKGVERGKMAIPVKLDMFNKANDDEATDTVYEVDPEDQEAVSVSLMEMGGDGKLHTTISD